MIFRRAWRRPELHLESPVIAPGFRFLRRMKMRNDFLGGASAMLALAAGGNHG
ncbi:MULTISPECIES: hypothetical protein [unclassified Sphingopyxis]|jgi:hypothetical protein|uniref:hypothetical protein n=1 Tax=unclassified Sphingopyxis TaxID=2614943 RepID=UPI001595C975|nr:MULTISPECIES: hypothetical protein [unclassified Sphingopyxis]HET6525440.1 hypothetical protein [Sphingopyxis sp.]HMO73796.1 hypothetical protein [Sphingopyxis sp.]HMQ19522.1 hypothetical protein [Sphingopyxis sp.]